MDATRRLVMGSERSWKRARGRHVTLSTRPGNTNLPSARLGRQEILPVHVLKRENSFSGCPEEGGYGSEGRPQPTRHGLPRGAQASLEM